MDLEKHLHRAFDMIGEKGWDAFELRDLVKDGVSAEELARCFPEKEAVLFSFAHMISEKLERAHFSFSPQDPLQERLFEVIMTRLDLLALYRAGCVKVIQSYEARPWELMGLSCQMQTHLSQMLKLAGEERPSLFLTLALMPFCGVLALKWSQDEDPNLEETMAFAHQGLGRIMGIVNC